jgi:hypothetical protein
MDARRSRSPSHGVDLGGGLAPSPGDRGRAGNRRTGKVLAARTEGLRPGRAATGRMVAGGGEHRG